MQVMYCAVQLLYGVACRPAGLYSTPLSHCIGFDTGRTCDFSCNIKRVCAIEFSSVGLRAIVADVTLSTQQDNGRSFAIPACYGRNITARRKTSVCVRNSQRWNSTLHNTVVTIFTAVVTICTTSLTFNNPTFCSHSVFMCFVWISEQTAIISLYSINWLVCITERKCVYCAVRTGCSNIIQVIRSL